MKIIMKLFLLALLVALCATPMMITAPSASAITPAVVPDEDQPHMQAALDALKQAEQHLQEAKHDKGGHRAKALAATREAIKHVEEGMKVADKK